MVEENLRKQRHENKEREQERRWPLKTRGERSIGATIKETRTKSRGRVEVGEGGGTGWGGVEGRGENADNCN